MVKLGAMSLGSGNPDSQVMLIHSVRDVAAALKDLIQATKDASGKHIGDPAMARLKDSAKVWPNEISFKLYYKVDIYKMYVYSKVKNNDKWVSVNQIILNIILFYRIFDNAKYINMKIIILY